MIFIRRDAASRVSALSYSNSNFNDFRWNEEENKSSRRAPLRNHQFAAVLLFQSHGSIQRDDRAFNLVVVRRLSRYPLQPQSGRRHQRKQRTPVLSRKTNDLVGNAGNQRQQRNPNPESTPESLDGNRHVYEH